MSSRFSYSGYDFEGISEGGVQTCITISRLSMMLDIGILPHEKINLENVLLTHGHLDHAAGIPYYISQRSLHHLKAPNIYVPALMYENLDAILKLYSKIEDFEYQYNLVPAETGKEYPLNSTCLFKPLKSIHRVNSQGYTIFERVKKLLPEYANLSPQEIVQLKDKKVPITEEKDTAIFSFSGDTQIEYVLENKEVQDSKILFLECTYIDNDRPIDRARKWGHTHLDEIIANADFFKNEKIVLIHFSKRYKNSYIRDTVKKKLPESLRDRVYCFLP